MVTFKLYLPWGLISPCKRFQIKSAPDTISQTGFWHFFGHFNWAHTLLLSLETFRYFLPLIGRSLCASGQGSDWIKKNTEQVCAGAVNWPRFSLLYIKKIKSKTGPGVGGQLFLYRKI